MLLNCDPAENTSPRAHYSRDIMNLAKKKKLCTQFNPQILLTRTKQSTTWELLIIYILTNFINVSNIIIMCLTDTQTIFIKRNIFTCPKKALFYRVYNIKQPFSQPPKIYDPQKFFIPHFPYGPPKLSNWPTYFCSGPLSVVQKVLGKNLINHFKILKNNTKKQLQPVDKPFWSLFSEQ